MEILYYNDLDYSKVKKQFEKIVQFLSAGDYKSAEIKKLQPTPYYRAKLDVENRLLFKFATYGDKTYLLLLEVILKHEYEKSRFLRGAEVDEQKIKALRSEKEVPSEDIVNLSYVNPSTTSFHLLDKPISFDQGQEQIFFNRPPLIIIGPAGSGKTALTIEKIKSLKGNVLYVTLSPYLVESSAKLYYSFGYNNEKQDIEFLSFQDFVQGMEVVDGKEIDYKAFEGWFSRVRNIVKIKDAHKLYEEFKGVLTGMRIENEYLTAEEYEKLGVKQSVFLPEERSQVYQLFEKYLVFLKENKLYDLNIISHKWLSICQPKYDFVIVDEVQDFTNVQLFLILKALKKKEDFILCGDSNQVVHPNFFSWANVKTMFYNSALKGNEIKILKTNYRNAPAVTTLANRLLKIKNKRFGSIDRESNYLVNAISEREGEIVYLQDTEKIKAELNQKTKGSTRFAILVMRNEDKAEARKIFKTPLLFSIQEAKGLEYDNIILVNFISAYDKEFREIANGIDPTDITDDLELDYSRAKDKSDKSSEVYKFYINSLYVAITRSIENLYLVESSANHEILKLLNLVKISDMVNISEQKSSVEEWTKEAHKLALQGKTEQAEEIRKSLLNIQPTPWKPLLQKDVPQLKATALDPASYNKKAKDLLFSYALIYNDADALQQLVEHEYKRAENIEEGRSALLRKYYPLYKSNDVKALQRSIMKYGVNFRDQFNLTPLHASVQAGSPELILFLKENGADTTSIDNVGRNALRIALSQSYFSPPYTLNVLGKVYDLIVSDSIKIKVDKKLVKIDNHKIEFFLLNYMIALQNVLVKDKTKEIGVQMKDFLQTIEAYPESVLPYYRKQRAYLNQAIARNEVDGKEGISKRLFLRIARGFYVLNPELDILIDDEWINVYELMQTEKLGKFDEDAYMDAWLEREYEKYPELRAIVEENIKRREERSKKRSGVKR